MPRQETEYIDGDYDGTTNIFRLTPYHFGSDVPCTSGIEYYVSEVAGPDYGDYLYLGFGLDGIFDGSSTDGQLKLSAS